MIKLSHNMIGRNYRVVCKDGNIHVGKCSSYIQALDNEPEIESISIGEIEIFCPDIESVERIS